MFCKSCVYHLNASGNAAPFAALGLVSGGPSSWDPLAVVVWSLWHKPVAFRRGGTISRSCTLGVWWLGAFSATALKGSHRQLLLRGRHHQNILRCPIAAAMYLSKPQLSKRCRARCSVHCQPWCAVQSVLRCVILGSGAVQRHSLLHCSNAAARLQYLALSPRQVWPAISYTL